MIARAALAGLCIALACSFSPAGASAPAPVPYVRPVPAEWCAAERCGVDPALALPRTPARSY